MKKILKRLDKTFYYTEGDVHTQYGVIKEDTLTGNRAVSNTGKEFIVFDAKFVDALKKIKRGAATMHLKDIGFILSHTGVGKDSVCLEAGAGSGMLTLCLSNVCKKVYSYEKNADGFKIVTKNLEKFKVENVELKNLSVSEAKETDIDLMVLDLQNPWDFLDVAYKSLKSGAYLVCYLPTVTQLSDLIRSFNEEFEVERVCEVLQRDWVVEGKKVRPLNQMLGHTAFLVFLRKV